MVTKKNGTFWLSGLLAALLTIVAVLAYDYVSARNRQADQDAAQSAEHDPLSFSWPFGWTPIPERRVANAHSEMASAVFMVGGKKVATIVVLIDRFTKHRTLDDEVAQRIKAEIRVTRKQGENVDLSPPVQDTWPGRPALRYDDSFVYSGTNQRIRQRTIFAMGSENITCSVWYAANEDDFDRYLPDVERVKSQVTCP
ncbi:hypothetical protein BJI69_19605 [Luteibacter rhizovicinus DSM 16549]|uniref:Uncharacterized protein n=1 Tax=Luteibacter rhizovicinus DSM 16549 TaxID=1440763 RepID=A0A0G9HBL3_9GAMM|nr:hypothetical protein [Luteibacter rhizovicinus]APG05892.1 hypothetical protein BJI69_19605 [Luteibacter rhizovicinus DSM 16549]KLD67160.1 hypothetical protein Y883_09395 [Luteibacter rhizovicinus DSM 16549]KLD73420.1 hypothetical protein Y886_38130 [Xanthomonas hyacinthi DSM 19077]